MRYILWILIQTIIYTINASPNCKIHPIYCSIIKLNPSIDKSWAMDISNLIYKESKYENVDPFIVVAIMMQESTMKINAINKVTKEIITTNCNEWHDCVTTITKTVKATDYGLFQFHRSTMENHNLDVEQVLSDWKFTTSFAIKLIAKKEKICKHKYPDTSYACYHSATVEKHKEYVKLVQRYYLGPKKEKKCGQYEE
jgi:hypothetical protein